MAATVRPITLGRYSDSVDAKDDEVTLLDNKKIYLGTGSDLQIYHDGSNSYIEEDGTGQVIIRGWSPRIQTGYSPTSGRSTGENAIVTLPDGAVELYYDAVKVCETASNGIKVLNPSGNGTLSIIGSEGNDAILQFKADDGDDPADHWRIVGDADGSLYIQNWTASAWETNIKGTGNGAVEVYYDGSVKFETNTFGCLLGDNSKLQIGGGADLQIYHDANNSFVNSQGTGHLYIRGDDVKIQDANAGHDMGVFIEDGAVELYYDNAKKLETKSDGVAITGNTYFDPATSASTTGSYFQSASAGRAILHIGGTSTASSSNKVIFANPNGTVGSITTDANATNFNTSSDYRLKENTVSISDGITRLKTLKPYRFNFKSDPTTTVDGFFAHEVTAVPEAVAGEKDGTEMQGMDYGRITPLLTAALQEAITKIETLETKVAALEAG